MSSTAVRARLADVPGAVETVLSQSLLSRLPDIAAAAPWDCRFEGVVWFTRGGRAATAQLPPALVGSRGLGVLGGFLRYTDTPVGAYDEVLGVVASASGITPWGHVGFMAVDSELSLVGGRSNWAMPKTLATFTGDIGSGEEILAFGDDALRWSVTAQPRAFGPALPLRGPAGSARQQFPDGSARASAMSFQGRVRPALVTVDVESEGPLASWLLPGRHLGAVIHGGGFTLGTPV